MKNSPLIYYLVGVAHAEASVIKIVDKSLLSSNEALCVISSRQDVPQCVTVHLLGARVILTVTNCALDYRPCGGMQQASIRSVSRLRKRLQTRAMNAYMKSEVSTISDLSIDSNKYAARGG